MDNILDALPDDRTVTWGETTFEIRKLLPTEAKPLFIRHVRPLLSGALDADMSLPDGDGTSEAAQWILAGRVLFAAFTKAPTEHYEAISLTMARGITVKRGTEERPLTGNEEWAWMGLEGAHMLLLDARAFAVNFKAWLVVGMSEFPQLVQAIALLSPPTSTPSSATS